MASGYHNAVWVTSYAERNRGAAAVGAVACRLRLTKLGGGSAACLDYPRGVTRSALVSLLLLFSSAACDPLPATEAPATSSASASSAAAPAFDVEGFCERTMALAASRRCEGDDTLIEGNKVGYCTTMLREARDAGRVRFDPAAAATCETAVKGASDLPDRRVLRDLSLRFEACRKVVTGTQSAGAACDRTMECGAGLLCLAKTCQSAAKEGEACRELHDDGFTPTASTCAPPFGCSDGQCVPADPRAAAPAPKPPPQPTKKKAGEPCTSSDDCLGRCSRSDGNTCVSYCGSG